MSWIENSCETFNYKNNDDDKLELNIRDMSDSSKYSSLGFSPQSQELICEFHYMIAQELPTRTNLFEELLYSFLDDLQRYQKDTKRLEKSYKFEKEKNDETVKQMIEEAERQLSSMCDRIKEQEKQEFDKMFEKQKHEYESQIVFLKENLVKMQELEKKFEATKHEDNVNLNELKRELEQLNSENKELKVKLRESNSKISILRSEIAELKENNTSQTNRPENLAFDELKKLKNEIEALNDANKKLSDANDILRNELELMKLRMPRDDLDITSSNFTKSSIEVDEDFDSGYMASHNKLSQNYDLNDTNPGQMNCESELDDSHPNQYDTQMLTQTACAVEQTLNVENSATIEPKNLTQIKESKQNDNQPPEKTFKVVLAGDSAVGKTSYIMRYCKGTFFESTSCTLGIDFHMKTVELDGRKFEIQLCDTCGQERFRSLSKSYFRRAEGAVLIYDCTSESSFRSVKEWIKLINETTDKRIPIVIVANKIDLRDQFRHACKVIDKEEGEKLAAEFNCLFLEASAKDGTNMDDSLIDLCRKMNDNQGDQTHNDDAIKLTNQQTVLPVAKKRGCC